MGVSVAQQEIDHGWKKIKKILSIEDAFVAVGFPGENTQSQKPVGDSGSFTMAGLAAVHEYGRKDDTIPSRPFMRQTFARLKGTIVKFQKKMVSDVLQNPTFNQLRKSLSQLGEWYGGHIKKTITSKGNFEPLKESTILRKKSSTPLVDSKTMANSITHKVFIKK